MNKRLLTILIFLSSFSFAQTSVYHPFPDSNATWNFHTSQWMCMPFGGVIDSYYSIMISGDTLINGMTYQKLRTPYVQSFSANFCTPYVFSGYKGAIREDEAAKKVYYIPMNDTTERLLYDFNLQVGDTVWGHLGSYSFSGFADTIVSIDSVLVGSEYRKRWEINPCYGIYMIEGIGSVYGLFEPSLGCITDGPAFILTCFTQEGQTLYPDTTSACEVITGILVPSGTEYKLSFSPNPFSSQTTVKIDPHFTDADYSLMNANGQIINRGKLNHQKELVISRDNLENGIYSLQLLNASGESVSAKFVIAAE